MFCAVHLLQVAKPLLLKAYELLLQATDLLSVTRSLNRESGSSEGRNLPSDHQLLIEHGRIWQAPLYEITLKLPEHDQSSEVGGWSINGKGFYIHIIFFLTFGITLFVRKQIFSTTSNT